MYAGYSQYEKGMSAQSFSSRFSCDATFLIKAWL